ncbi:maleylpyruvate isomerase family mycothiol-dependent enzyme [Streptomyces peucetius]|uniref:Maleylpyruvate isomerase family mycothiol-dependent enzyme n=1 Tax=Streptomyces peucetius TaxID=1950 RepID=A0ABY6I4C8_STRPE|nr:maleylpyruvate isomerase family mycothiol-dependent enzyme [Streptomyces peucetius]UYQ60862.1 maleylpyruvate isomerase family mycothiol-dependent enzyme [Streptomyces peucetius]
MSDALLNALAEALAEVVTLIDTCDDDVLDPDTAVKWLEATGFLLDRLPPADRRELAALVRRAADRQPDGGWRDDLLRVPDGFGLDDDQHERYCDAVERLVGEFVAAVRGVDPAIPVPTCPGWTVGDLVKHHGTTHRWAEHVVRTRAAERVWARDVPLDLPDDPSAYPDWVARSAEAALRTVRKVDPDLPMWSYGEDQRVAFYPRRLLFEAVIHLADAQLALGREPRVAPGTAADGIEEFLENLPHYSWITERLEALPDGSVSLVAQDTGAAWTIAFGAAGFSWTKTASAAPVTVTSTAADLLLLLYGRRRPTADRFTVTGRREVLDGWVGAMAF